MPTGCLCSKCVYHDLLISRSRDLDRVLIILIKKYAKYYGESKRGIDQTMFIIDQI